MLKFEVEYEFENGSDVRFRTFRVFKNVEETQMSNGDILIRKKLMGRVIAVTVPVDDSKNYFYAEFAFCSTKDNFSKTFGKNLAHYRLMKKLNMNEDMYIIKRSEDESITDALREIIAVDNPEITWLSGVKISDIM